MRLPPSAGRSERGYTSVELLATISIVVVLFSLTTLVYLVARERGKVVVDISNLRQIGVAHAIYVAENDDRLLLSYKPLYETGRVDPLILVSPSDPTEEGIADRTIRHLNRFDPERIPELSIPVRASYVAVSHFWWDEAYFMTRVDGRAAPGWLVNVARSEPWGEGHYEGGLGPFQRLCFDGSVQSRRLGYSTYIDDDGVAHDMAIDSSVYFGDPR